MGEASRKTDQRHGTILEKICQTDSVHGFQGRSGITTFKDPQDFLDPQCRNAIQRRKVCLFSTVPLMRFKRRGRSTIRITLENVSPLPIDYLNLTFDDSTMGLAQQALLEGELSVFDTYETEYDLVHRQVLTWDAENGKIEIPPGKMMTMTVNCFGKAGWCGLSAKFSAGLALTNLKHERINTHILRLFSAGHGG